MTSIATSSDIIPGSHDIALGERWFPPEQHRGLAFRWVENDAVVHVAALTPLRHALRVVVEPGPGVGLEPFTLSAREPDGTELGSFVVASKQVVTFPLPPERPRVFSITLHAAAGGKSSPNDARVLNFRVFALGVERTSDVFPAWAEPRDGFYALERHAGSEFRWVGGDATIAVHRVHGDTLSFDAESGPGLGSKPFQLLVAGPDGTALAAPEVASRTTVHVPLRALEDGGSLTLHAQGGGRAVTDDPRTLNFRVFAAAQRR
jgi:hypothetical protein